MIKVITASSLDKVFITDGPSLPENRGSMLKNEKYNFQVWIYSSRHIFDCKLKIEASEGLRVLTRGIDPVPVVFGYRPDDSDDYVICKNHEQGLYPDILRPLNPMDVTLRPYQWTGYWVTVECTDCKASEESVKIYLFDKDDNQLGFCEYKLEIIDCELPSSDLIYTNWVHYDCIAHYHKKELFSKEYYEVLNRYLINLKEHGGNMLYTPIFTPALDTEIGSERDTVQLLDIEYNNGIYNFNFDKLDYFIDNAQKIGFEYFEFAHFATQWGAEYCPKIIVRQDGVEHKMFGWHTRSDSKEYLDFLSQLLPALCSYLEQKGIFDKCRFHISDEPYKDHLATYEKLSKHIKSVSPKIKTMDAISLYDYYSGGLVDTPVVALDKTAPFRENHENYWVYNCCTQRKNYVSNRFINMPSQRTRILGFQLYLNNVKGYLHWGYNFYKTYLSRVYINPYSVNDGYGIFEAGDSFVVYPYEDGVINSLRHEVIYDSWQDYRALKALEKLTSRDFVLNLLKEQGMDAFEIYPKDPVWHKNFREKINAMIKSFLSA
ncbi:MAG TPA: DUF4091 domain-containing protein [Clostridia bacterium]|jgi:hypothetical protein